MLRSLSTKIGLGYLTLVLVNIAVAVFAIYRIDQLSQPIDQILTEKYQNVQAAENMLLAISKLDLLQFAMIDEGVDAERTIEFNVYKNDFQNWHQRAIQGVALPSEPEILDSLMIYFREFIHYSDSLRRMMEKAIAEDSARVYHHHKVIPYLDQVVKNSNHLKEINEQALSQADRKAQEISGKAKNIIIIFSVLAVMISIAASIFFTRKILKPVQDTTETVRRIGKGQFNQKVRIDTNDEIALLGIEFNKMTARLQEYEEMNIKQILLEKRKTETVVANIPVAILVTDEENRVTLINDQAQDIFDIKDESWPGKYVSVVIRPEILEQLQTPSDKSDQELVKISVKGNDAYYLHRRVNISDEQNRYGGQVSLLQDVTSFKKLDHLKSEFIAAVSHELKTPLTSINMAIDIILNEVRGSINEEQKDLLSGAKDDINRMKKFLLQLLELTRLESGAFPMRYYEIQPLNLAKQAVRQLQLKIDQKKIRLIHDYHAPLPVVFGDEQQLLRVLLNLLENAIRHTLQEGEITITIGSDDEFIEFSVKDNGEGIAVEDQELIFDKFVQIENFEKSDRGSVGLGLAICKEIVHAHDGRIAVTSKPGAGSLFSFSIPLKLNDREKQDE